MKKLLQKRFLQGKREFSIIDNDKIKISYKTLSNTSEEIVNLYDLEEKYEKIIYRELKWLFFAIPMFLISAKFILDAINLNSTFPLGYATFFILLSAISVLYFFHTQQSQLIYRYRESTTAALVFWDNKPNIKEFNAFISTLSDTLKKTYLPANTSNEEKLELYYKYLEFLFNEDVLSEKESNQIFKRIEKKLERKKTESVISIVK